VSFALEAQVKGWSARIVGVEQRAVIDRGSLGTTSDVASDAVRTTIFGPCVSLLGLVQRNGEREKTLSEEMDCR